MPKSDISDFGRKIRNLFDYVVLNFRMEKYPINYPIRDKLKSYFWKVRLYADPCRYNSVVLQYGRPPTKLSTVSLYDCEHQEFELASRK